MIEYKTTHDFTPQELERLFLSLEWSSGHFPDKLAAAMKNYETVISAWDGGKLVGMICAMDDGVMTAYMHYLLVDPDYQGQSIGRKLVEMFKEKYKDYLRLVLIAYESAVPFYEKCGFAVEDKSKPMFITSLWT
ncbi:MAG: GNAT family N-acetyltransferase [Ruminococcus sp.]|nr:GNAT family N-acetyltransferase [Ruminococcus sp.]